jgi:hypothetical protein
VAAGAAPEARRFAVGFKLEPGSGATSTATKSERALSLIPRRRFASQQVLRVVRLHHRQSPNAGHAQIPRP